ncbi:MULTISPECIES: DUF4127 family protein [Paenibacillus]|uniref:DUF4127 family protein n=1 Tax=Paenibacillus albilobatus TaxID=2716884 RepID=A0A919XGK3_9BACL|nr:MULTISPECIES: DUF4127 family protein [Paenibacillus]GIO32224.1 hypothetical protein J2TS6_33650 [Paenibacillus albilobatus]
MKKVLYVPLDDRPCNLDDVVTQAKAAGIHVIIPDADDVKNRLDTEADSEGNTLVRTYAPVFGNTGHIRQFIRDHIRSADGFIISSDMLAYGGLIGSRRFRADGGGAYPNYDPDTTGLLDVIREIKQTCPHKPVFVLDTIMRLATTVFVEGLTQSAYDEARAFAQQPRVEASEFEAILDGYDIKPDGTHFGTPVHFDKEQYYNARRHKFKTNYYILDQLVRTGAIDFLAVGVDDSYTQGVQANEIAFLEDYVDRHLNGSDGQNPDRVILLPDADGLGYSLMGRMASHLHQCGSKPRYGVRYFGPDGSTIINPYEYMSVHDNIRYHVNLIGGRFVDSGPCDVEIVAVTGADRAAEAADHAAANARKRQLTVVIDFVGGGAADETVTQALLDQTSTGLLLGYSGWNTAGNKIGMALGMAHSRHAFLVTERRPHALDTAVDAHGSLLFKRFLKDYCYKKLTIAEVRTYSRAHTLFANVPYADQNMLLFNSPEDYEAIVKLLRDRMQTNTEALSQRKAFLPCASQAIRQIKRPGGWICSTYNGAALAYENPGFIWGRAFEITLRPSVTLQS